MTFVDVVTAPDALKTQASNPSKTMLIETFDHFFYTLKISDKDPDGNYEVAIAVKADIPTERVTSKDEEPNERKKLDEEFQTMRKSLEDKLAREQALSPWVYVIESSLVEPLIPDRAQLLATKTIVSKSSTTSDNIPLTTTQ